jgi:hypothetical protein
MKDFFWLPWLGATFISALTLTAFIFVNFETKADSNDKRSYLEKRLDRIEFKIDEIKNRLSRK